MREDTNANPILLDALGLNRGYAFFNGNDLGLYWLMQGICQDQLILCNKLLRNKKFKDLFSYLYNQLIYILIILLSQKI
jgi:hypothetical protein